MQWFLTLFATCLPKSVLLRVWDCLFLEGAEVLFRSSIAIWDKLAPSVLKATSADSFYTLMSVLTVNLFDKHVLKENEFMAKVYSYGPFPLAGLEDLREKLMFNISPFQAQSNLSKTKPRSGSIGLSSLKLTSDDKSDLLPDITASNELSLRSTQPASSSSGQFSGDDEVEDLAQMISCFALLMPNRSISNTSHASLPHNSTRNEIMLQAAAAASVYGTKLVAGSGSSKKSPKQHQALDDATPGAFSYITQMYSPKPLGEELTSDLNELKKQYQKLKERQRQAYVIVHSASDQYKKQSERGVSGSVSRKESQRSGVFSSKLEAK